MISYAIFTHSCVTFTLRGRPLTADSPVRFVYLWEVALSRLYIIPKQRMRRLSTARLVVDLKPQNNAKSHNAFTFGDILYRHWRVLTVFIVVDCVRPYALETEGHASAVDFAGCPRCRGRACVSCLAYANNSFGPFQKSDPKTASVLMKVIIIYEKRFVLGLLNEFVHVSPGRCLNARIHFTPRASK